VAKIHPLLEEIEFNERVNSLLTFEEMPYILRDSKLREEKLQTIEKMRIDVENSGLNYESKSRILQKIYGNKFALSLKEGNDYLQLLASGGLGFILGFLANDNLRNYFNKLARDFITNLPQYSKS